MNEDKKCCVDCRTTKTPLWRGGPAGPKVSPLLHLPLSLHHPPWSRVFLFCLRYLSVSCLLCLFSVTVLLDMNLGSLKLILKPLCLHLFIQMSLFSFCLLLCFSGSDP